MQKVNHTIVVALGCLVAILAAASATLPKWVAEVRWKYLTAAAGPEALQFRVHTVAKHSWPERDLLLVTDVDRDGRTDLIVGGKQGPLVWLQNTGASWEQHKLDPGSPALEAGGALHDIDGDGDLDLVAGDPDTGRSLYWWECPEDPTRPWKRRVIATLAPQFHDQAFGDFNGDGRPDLVFWNQGAATLYWVTVPADPTVSPWPNLGIVWQGEKAEGLLVADVDGDGRDDVVAGGAWYRAPQDPASPWTRHVISSAYSRVRIAAGDLTGDGRVEIVLSDAEQSPARVAWFRAAQPTGKWTEHRLRSGLFHVHSLAVADFDGDGYADVFAAEMDLNRNTEAQVLVFRNTDGKGDFAEHVVSRGLGVHEARVADMDGDGDVDIVGKPYRGWAEDRIVLWENQRPAAAQFSLGPFRRVLLDEKKPWRSIFILPADLNGDGRADLVTGGWWYRNPGPSGGHWVRQAFPALNNVAAVFDVDNDGDLDVLGTKGRGSDDNPALVWLENMGGEWRVHDNLPRGAGDFLQGAAVADYLQGGRPEVALSWHRPGTPLEILEIPDDPTQPWAIRVLSERSLNEELSACDVDGDGDPDIVLGTAWLENAGSQRRWPLHRMADRPANPDRNRVADIDGDGRLDVVVGEEAISTPGSLTWLQNPGGAGRPWPVHRIARIVGPMSLDVADLDGDGDVDVVVGEHNMAQPARGRVLLYENLERGLRWQAHVVDTGYEHHDGTQLVDVDGDGRLDIASISWSNPGVVLLYINQGNRAGQRASQAGPRRKTFRKSTN